MKCKCPQCGNVCGVKWYSTKVNIHCPQCDSPMFKKHEKKLRLLSGFACGFSCLVATNAMRIYKLDLLGNVLLNIILITILILCAKFIEQIICKDLRVR